ncbi:MAG: hypothetical protein PWQ09_1495 [Candidatus Cloacimonadota bacterium]|nr:hypothetical protein [Candidatus Cloacimonadota bacterium]
MRKSALIAVLCFSFPLLISQNSINLPASPDSLSTITDSLQTISDSLEVYSDSLSSSTTNLEKEATYSSLELKKNIDDYLNQHALQEYDFITTSNFVISENFHLKTLFTPPATYTKYGFTYFAPFGSMDLLLQKLAPFQNLSYTNNHYDFGQAEYKQPVTLVESFLGLGDEDMNHALASMKKYEFLGIDNLGINAGYLGQEGFWGNQNESSQNFHFNSSYHHELGSLKVFYHKIDEEMAGAKLDSSEIVNWSSEEIGAKLKNKILDVGFRHDNSELQNQQQKTDVLLLSKNIDLSSNNINFSYEYFWQETQEFKLYSLEHSLQSTYVEWLNNARYKNSEDFLFSSFANSNLYGNWGLVGEFVDSKSEDDHEKYGAGLQWNSNYLQTYILAGKYSINSETSNYARGVIKLNLELTPILINLNNNWQWLQDETALYPVWQQQSAFGIAYQLPYGNQINLNFIYQNYSDFQQTDGDFLKIRLSIDITNKFNIKAEAVNPFSKEEIKGFPLTQSHFLFGVNWFFLN